MIVKEININDIKIIENVRIKIEKLEGLMQDIKQHGLYNPIKVAKTKTSDYILVQGNRRLMAVKKLGWKTVPATVSEDMEIAELLVNNMAENIHREDIIPVELGRICFRLKSEMGLSVSEISAKLSLPVSKVNGALDAYRGLPDKYRNKVSYVGSGGKNRNGSIPATVALKVMAVKRQYGLSDAGVDKLLNVVKVEEFGSAELHLINLFLGDGLTVTQAIEALKEYKYMRTDVVVNTNEIEALLKKYKIDSSIQLLNAIVYGELPPLKRPKFFKTKQIPVVG